MQQSSREIWAAFIAIIVITLVYLFVFSQTGGIPGASGLFGHSLGISGFILMAITETLYSWRKRSLSARWGRMSNWLRFHIFTGLVGSYMVLLHSSWKFNGLAGIVMLLTVIIVVSGIVGRYIYTAIPRTADGSEIEKAELDRQIAEVERVIQEWRDLPPEIIQRFTGSLLGDPFKHQDSILAILGRTISETGYRINAWRLRYQLKSSYRTKVGELVKLLRRKRTLERQIASLIIARRLLSLWHAVHIPIGVALFSTALVHMAGAIYYATLLR